MNKKIKRGMSISLAVFVVISFLSLIIPSTQALDYGCCFHPENFCQNLATAEECCGEPECAPSIFDPNRPCYETQCEWQGCCLQTCSMTQYKDCNYDFTPIADLAPTYTCDSEPECGQGCCVYLTAGNDLGSCEIKTQSQCQPETFYPNVQFHNSLSESECNAICDLNTSVSGTITGFIFNQITLDPISDAQVTALGLTTFTNFEGFFNLSNIASGSIPVEVSATNYIPISITLIIEQGETTTHDFFLEEILEEGATLKGQVQNTNNQGIFGFVYYAQDSTFTNFDGYYTLNNVPSGYLEITAIANYYQPAIDYLTIDPQTLNTHDFILESEEQSELCGNGVINFGEDCEPSDDNACPGLCSNCQCPDSCNSAGGECYSWDYQCTGNSGNKLNIEGIDLCSAYNYQDSSYGCCDKEPEDIPPCIDATQNNQPISSTDLSQSSGTMCVCGQQYFDIANPDQSEGYCCDEIYHTSSETCELAGTIYGFISSFDTVGNQSSEPIIGADLLFTNINTSEESNTISYDEGFYVNFLSTGDYSVLIEKIGYEPTSNVFSIESAEYLELNFTLAKLEFVCSEENITTADLTINHFKGIKKLELIWNQSCLDYVDYFEIIRNEQIISTISPQISSYFDNSIEWDTQYSYQLKTVSTGGIEYFSNIILVDSGTSICENKFEDESWCFDNTKRVVCNENNQPVLWDGYLRGSENGDCNIAIGNGSICQQEKDESWCTQTEDCSQTGLYEHNIFGLFYNLLFPTQSCLYNDIQSSDPTRRYCYYDAYQTSFTSVDKCLSCSPEMTCFDYQTENGCSEDNCLIGERNGLACEWQTSYENFQLLGKGYCTPTGYQNTDHCSDCSSTSDIFSNTQCTYDICSNLGSCYSSENNSACLSCSQDTTCESYLTEDDCTGSNNIPFKIEGDCNSNYNLQLSQDNCNLGRCKWKNNECIKNGNDDNKEDCSGNALCLKDNHAPITSIVGIPPFINFEGQNLMFNIEDNSVVNYTYYCIGKTCCPQTLINNNSIFLDGNISELYNKEGFININYYSIDVNKNTEQIKNSSIYFDTKNPDLNVYYYIQNSSNTTLTSDLFINLSVSEDTFCSGTFIPTNNSLLPNIFISSSYLLEYPNLGDGRYQLSLICTDFYQNSQSFEFNISVDRYHKIVEEYPHLLTLPVSDINISIVSLKDNLYCTYQSINDPVPKQFNQEQSGFGNPYGEDFIYKSNIGVLDNGTYNYDIECFNQNGGDLKDTSQIIFTIDSLAPITQLLLLNPDGQYREVTEQPYPFLNFDFNCEDAFQEAPGGIGCGNTYFCITQNDSCIPTYQFFEPTTFSSESAEYTICYFSKDLLNNSEEFKCNSVNIDSSSPEIIITSPDMLLTTQSMITIEGTWEDTSPVEIFVKTRNAKNIISDSVLATLNPDNTFTAELALFSGFNEISATIYDDAGNYYSDLVIIYYDDQGPTVKDLIIRDTNEENNPDSDFILEYSSNLLFEAGVNDFLYSDIYDERTTDVSSVSLKLNCIKSSGCDEIDIEEIMYFDNESSKYFFNYDINQHGLLKEGNYILQLIMVDEFDNVAEEIYTIKIRDTIGYFLQILNHENQRMDTAAFKGESGYPINFVFYTPKTPHIEYGSLILTHENPIAFKETFDLGKPNSSFEHTIYNYLPEGHYTSSYMLIDKLGKSYHESNEFDIADTLPPAFNLTILKENIPVNSIGFGIYEVLIHSFEPIVEISSLEYSFDGKEDTVKDISGQDQNWQGNLYIPEIAEYLDLNDIDSTFEIDAQDLNGETGGNILYGKEFIINTQGPGVPIIFSPEQNSLIIASENQYFSGKSPDWNPDLEIIFKRNKVSQNPIAPGWENIGSADVRQNNPLLVEWKTAIYGPIQLLEQNKIRVNDPTNIFQPGRFFDFYSIKTPNRLYREILEVSLYSDPDGTEKYYDITFSPELTTPVENYQGQQTAQDILIFNSLYPEGWFDGSIQLSPGLNYIALQTKSPEGNYGQFSKIFTIIYDPTAPEISYVSPTPDSYTNDEQPLIKITIDDLYSSVDLDSIEFSVQEEGYTLKCSETYCVEQENQQFCSSLNCYKNEDGHETKISYLSPIPLITGWKEINIIADDLAGNKAEKTWGFWVDGLAPSTPNINISPGNRVQDDSPYTLYSNNNKPSLDVNFLKYETIELLDYYLLDLDKNIISNLMNLNKISDNQFSGGIIDSLEEKDYYIYLEAKKLYPNGTWSNPAFWYFPLTIDQTNPLLSTEMPPQTNGRDAIITIDYIEENPHYIEFSEGATGTINYKNLYSPFYHLLTLTEEQGEKIITTTLYDKASNQVSDTITTYLDSIGPEVSDDYVYDNQWVTSPQTVQISASDIHGIKNIKYCTVSTCNPLDVGQNLTEPYSLYFGEEQVTNISYVAIDTFDNPSDFGSFRILFDKTPPTLNLYSNPNVNTQETFLFGRVIDINANKIEISGDLIPITYYIEVSNELFTIPLVLNEGEGLKNIIVTAYDLAGNSIEENIDINLDFNANPLTINYIEDSLKVEDYFISSEDKIIVHGYYLLPEDSIIYSKLNPTNVAFKANGEFIIELSMLDGYILLEDQEKTNIITLVGEESNGNNHEVTFTVIRDDNGPIITLINPRSQSTKSNTPLIQILTDELADCDISYTTQTQNFGVMDTLDNLNHEFQITKQLLLETDISIHCVDLSNKDSEFNFTLKIDNTKPIIYYADMYGAELLSQNAAEFFFLLFRDQETSITAFANEPVRCKHGTNLNYESMIPFIGFEEYDFAAQQISSSFTLANGYHDLFMMCEDRAGNLAQPIKLGVTVNTNLPIQILNLQPEDYTNEKNPELYFQTYRNSSCEVQVLDGYDARVLDYATNKYEQNNAKTSVLKVNNKFHHSTIISGLSDEARQMTELSDNNIYGFTIHCQSSNPDIEDSEIKELFFTTDFTIPNIDIISPNNGITVEDTYLPIEALTEENSDYTIYVNNVPQTHSTKTDGTISDFAILQEGNNIIKIEVYDKANNFAKRTLFIKYQNLGPESKSITPLNKELLPPIKEIKAEIVSNSLNLDSEIKVYGFDTEQYIIPDLGVVEIINKEAILTISDPSKLQDGLYRYYVVPIADTQRGEGKNILFEIGEKVPEIWLNSPYNELPYKGFVTNNHNTIFAGIISSDTLLQAELHINGDKVEEFNDLIFSLIPDLEQGINNFVIKATTITNDVAIRYGDITLDSEGPLADINIE